MTPVEAGVRILLGLLPVFSFLVVLILLDGYKLVRPRSVVLLIAAGALTAAVSIELNSLILDHGRIDPALPPPASVDEDEGAPQTVRRRGGAVHAQAHRVEGQVLHGAPARRVRNG